MKMQRASTIRLALVLLVQVVLISLQIFEMTHAFGTSFIDAGAHIQRQSKKLHKASKFVSMYFDDVSRYETQWNGFKTIVIPTNDVQQVNKQAAKQTSALVKQKLSAIHENFSGYDSDQAARFSSMEIQCQTTEWASKSGLVGGILGDAVYESIKSVHVSTSTTVLECVADFWKTLVTVIEREKTNEFDGTDGTQLVLIVYPNCPELYDYKVMSTIHTAIDFCSGTCLHFGSKFTLTHFHPKFKNAPSMIYPTRHSPFPSFGLHFPGKYDEYVQHLSVKYGSDPKKKKIADAEIPPEREWVKERANTFEVLYNKAAVSSTSDNLSRSAALRNISQRFHKTEVIETTKKWIAGARYMISLPASPTGEINKALEFADTVRPDSWHVISEKTPEECYAAIWAIIGELERLAYAERFNFCEKQEGVDVNTLRRFNQLQWMYSLCLPAGEKVNDITPPTIMSAMFITTKFRAYNAEGFKRFAITVNAALKRLTSEKMFLEVFHPEYCGKKGYDNKRRRSPFPMLQICYNFGKNTKNSNSNNAPAQ
jgi:hypothetical protein